MEQETKFEVTFNGVVIPCYRVVCNQRRPSMDGNVITSGKIFLDRCLGPAHGMPLKAFENREAVELVIKVYDTDLPEHSLKVYVFITEVNYDFAENDILHETSFSFSSDAGRWV